MSANPALTVVCFSFSIGGSESIAAAVARYCHARGVATTVCATHGGRGPMAIELEAAGIRCVALSSGGGGRLGLWFRLFRHLRDTRASVVHVHHLNMLLLAYLPARLAGVRRIVVTEHSVHQLRRSPRLRRRAIPLGRKADLVTVVHDGLAEYLTSEGMPPSQLRVIPNGVDTAVYRPRVERELLPGLGLPLERVLFTSVGRLHPDKDPLNLVRAVGEMSADERRLVHVVLIGDGPLRDDLRALIGELELGDCVTLLGEREDVDQLLGEFDVFVLPSRTEGLPVALLEAMSCGLPVIATDVGGVPDALDGGGIVVPASDPRALAAAMVELAGNRMLRRQFGDAARRHAVAEHDRQVMLADYQAVLFGQAGG